MAPSSNSWTVASDRDRTDHAAALVSSALFFEALVMAT